MMEHVNHFKAAMTAALAALTALWGWFGWLLLAWVACMVLDYITGTSAAMKGGTWSSKAAREGLWHKMGSVCAVLISGILDLGIGVLLEQADGLPIHFDYTVLLCPVVVIWYIITEAGSIVENAGELGAPIPSFLKQAIEALKDKVENGEEE